MSIVIPATWRAATRFADDGMWHPRSPDNMLVRHKALQEGRANPGAFPGLQDHIRSLARKRRRMGRLPPPTDEEWEAFVQECLAAGMVRAEGRS